MEKNPRMLEGYRVLDFTHYVAGPTCTRILGEMGADVIKVERSKQGDHVRALGMVRDGMSSYYFQHNHSKRSLALDFQKPEAKELVLKLIPKIDIVVENFAPGVIGAMGFGYEALKKINPRLIMVSVSVAGQTGPLSSKPGYDYLGQALAESPIKSARPIALRSSRRWRSVTSRLESRQRWRWGSRCSIASAPARGLTSTHRCSTPTSICTN
jgi:crotonobetainyl-CoA:carnitine CoA-transferase CaiB-like acyl-CoA transferase